MTATGSETTGPCRRGSPPSISGGSPSRQPLSPKHLSPKYLSLKRLSLKYPPPGYNRQRGHIRHSNSSQPGHGVLYSFYFHHDRLDFLQFDPVPADLDLLILTPDIL